MVYNYFVLFSSLLSRFKTILSCLELLCQITGLIIFNRKLFYRYTLRQVAWLVYVGAFDNGDVVAE